MKCSSGTSLTKGRITFLGVAALFLTAAIPGYSIPIDQIVVKGSKQPLITLESDAAQLVANAIKDKKISDVANIYLVKQYQPWAILKELGTAVVSAKEGEKSDLVKSIKDGFNGFFKSEAANSLTDAQKQKLEAMIAKLVDDKDLRSENLKSKIEDLFPETDLASLGLEKKVVVGEKKPEPPIDINKIMAGFNDQLKSFCLAQANTFENFKKTQEKNLEDITKAVGDRIDQTQQKLEDARKLAEENNKAFLEQAKNLLAEAPKNVGGRRKDRNNDLENLNKLLAAAAPAEAEDAQAAEAAPTVPTTTAAPAAPRSRNATPINTNLTPPQPGAAPQPIPPAEPMNPNLFADPGSKVDTGMGTAALTATTQKIKDAAGEYGNIQSRVTGLLAAPQTLQAMNDLRAEEGNLSAMKIDLDTQMEKNTSEINRIEKQLKAIERKKEGWVKNSSLLQDKTAAQARVAAAQAQVDRFSNVNLPPEDQRVARANQELANAKSALDAATKALSASVEVVDADAKTLAETKSALEQSNLDLTGAKKKIEKELQTVSGEVKKRENLALQFAAGGPGAVGGTISNSISGTRSVGGQPIASGSVLPSTLPNSGNLRTNIQNFQQRGRLSGQNQR